MAVTTQVYGLFAKGQINGSHFVDADTDTLKLALLTSGYAPNFDTHEFFSQITNEVAAGAGYTAGGVALTSPTVGYDAAGNFAYLDADDAVWLALTKTFRYAVLYKSTGVAGTSPLILLIDFGADQSPAGIDFVVQWAAAAAGAVLKAAAA